MNVKISYAGITGAVLMLNVVDVLLSAMLKSDVPSVFM